MTSLRIIIVGGGRVGYHTARHLHEQDHDVVLVEHNERRAQEISDDYFATVITGDGARPDVLRQADPASADAIAGLTPNPGANIGACVLAQRINPDIRTVIRVSSPEGMEGYQEVVDQVVFPERAGAHVASNAILGEAVHSMEALPGELDIVEVEVAEGAPVAGRALAKIRFPEGALVVSDEDGDAVAGSETTLSPGERYLVATEPGVADEVMNLMRG
jgi:trk system potassium uptake protein TrkA